MNTSFTATDALTAAQAGGNDLFLTGLMFVGMFAVVYFLMIRPQKKQRDQHAKLIAALKKGDEVVLSSGIIGKIFAVEDRVVVLDVGRDTRMRVMKQAVTNTTQALLAGRSDEADKPAEKKAAKADAGGDKSEAGE